MSGVLHTKYLYISSFAVLSAEGRKNRKKEKEQIQIQIPDGIRQVSEQDARNPISMQQYKVRKSLHVNRLEANIRKLIQKYWETFTDEKIKASRYD